MKTGQSMKKWEWSFSKDENCKESKALKLTQLMMIYNYRFNSPTYIKLPSKFDKRCTQILAYPIWL